jgi:hypothetical protein
MSDVGCRILDVGCRMSDVGCWMLGVGCRILEIINLSCKRVNFKVYDKLIVQISELTLRKSS